MPNIKSAKKRVLVNETKYQRNRAIKTQVKTAFKKFDLAIIAQDKDAARAAYINAVSSVDKATSKGVIHKNTAGRNKSRMANRLNALDA